MDKYSNSTPGNQTQAGGSGIDKKNKKDTTLRNALLKPRSKYPSGKIERETRKKDKMEIKSNTTWKDRQIKAENYRAKEGKPK